MTALAPSPESMITKNLLYGCYPGRDEEHHRCTGLRLLAWAADPSKLQH